MNGGKISKDLCDLLLSSYSPCEWRKPLLSRLPSLPQSPVEQTASRSDRGGHIFSPGLQGAWPRG